MQPTPFRPEDVQEALSSTQRLSIEYEGWWMRSGVPRSRRMCDRFAGALRGVGADAHVARLARAHRRVQRTHGLLERRVRVEPMGVEDVHVVQPQAREDSGRGSASRYLRDPGSRRGRATCPAGLGGDHQLLAVGPRGGRRGDARSSPPRTRWRPVVVGQVEVGDAQVERASDDGTLAGEGSVLAEVVPQPERDGGQLEAAARRSAGSR